MPRHKPPFSVARYAMPIVSVLLGILFLKFHNNLKAEFESIDKEYEAGTAILLAKGVDRQALSDILEGNAYAVDKQDADFIAAEIGNRLDQGMALPGIYGLQKKNYQVLATRADSLGGKGLKERVRRSYQSLRVDDILSPTMPPVTDRCLDVKRGTGTVAVRVRQSDKNRAVPDVWVQLRQHYYDGSGQGTDTIVGYARTDKRGKAVFIRLDTSLYYSIVPVKYGYEYGMAVAITPQKFSVRKGEIKCDFKQSPHTITLFGNVTYRKIRDDGVLTVRTPATFCRILLKWFLIFMAAWWGLYGYLFWKSKGGFNRKIVALLMFLTGFCLLTMFSLPRPLLDEVIGEKMAKYVVLGILGIFVVQRVDVIRFFQNGYGVKFDYLNYRYPKFPKGLVYFIIALFLTLLLFTPLGQAVGGMRVNLNLGLIKFQPSEVTKFLVIIFISAFFYANRDKIISYSQPGNVSYFGYKLKILSYIFLCLGSLLAVYLLLGDVGPALVLCVTFIFMYSLIKSKIQLENVPEEEKYKRILASDFAMMLYGVFTFALFLLAGKYFGHMWIACLVWFPVWLIWGMVKRKQVFESAVFLNLVIALFIFSGSIFQYMPGRTFRDIEHRMESRLEMCTNTWGSWGLYDGIQKPCPNDQVAQGLWGIASGGFSGQGFGKGSSYFIPAFHTDMILESIGEQAGWWGVAAVVLCLAFLLRQSLLVGYRTGHTFAFYLSCGIAVVTCVQFIIIALGSVGLIPLTGVTVPMLSNGGVSMVLNLIAFGIIISLSYQYRQPTEAQIRNMAAYNYAISITSVAYVWLTGFILLTFLAYQSVYRNKTLVRPVFVASVSGEPNVQYNPRINQVIQKIEAGNIYDRNGIILATSNKDSLRASEYIRYGVAIEDIHRVLKQKTRRYYPFGNHLLFMVGDYNTGVPFNYSDVYPTGYLAESRHFSALRGFDNILRDKQGHPVKMNIDTTFLYKENSFLPPVRFSGRQVVLRDYRPIVRFLKRPDETASFNKNRAERDMALTIDAVLQMKLQNEISEFMSARYKAAHFNRYNRSIYNKMRVSVVVLQAHTGELLASANYPLPNPAVLWEAPKRYDEKNLSRKAYTDRDLGLVFQTPPGSTAKVMSALAGFMKFGERASDISYYIDKDEIIERGVIKEPYSSSPAYAPITMTEAITNSSNVYFINLINDKDLYAELDSIYYSVGIRLDVERKGKTTSHTPYFLFCDEGLDKGRYASEVFEKGRRAVARYETYIRNRDQDKNNRICTRFNKGELYDLWGWAWGQSTMSATPLDMARVTSIVANGGVMPTTKYLLEDNPETGKTDTSGVRIVDERSAAMLKAMMQREAEKRDAKWYVPKGMGGKTGTPERDFVIRRYNDSTKRYEDVTEKNKNDAWYMFFIETAQGPLSVVIRVERSWHKNSALAVDLAYSVVVPALQQCLGEVKR